MVMIKATTLLISMECRKKELGEKLFQKIITSLDEKDRQIITKPIILPTEWIPYDTYDNYTKAILDIAFKGNEYEYIRSGVEIASKSINSIYKALLRFGSPEFIVKRASVYINMLFQGVEITTTQIGPNEIKARCMGFEKKHHCIELGMIAWIKSAFMLSGAKNCNVKITKPLSDDAGYFEITGNWE